MPFHAHRFITPSPRPSPTVLGFDNVFEKPGTYTATGTDHLNAFDWLTHDGWLTTAAGASCEINLTTSADADYFAFAGHNMHTYSAEIKLEYYNGATWVEVADARPGTSDPMIVLFDRVGAERWRVTVTTATAVTIGIISAGLRLTMEHGQLIGHTPPRFGNKDRILNNRTQNGQFLGRSVLRQGAGGTLSCEYMHQAWARTYFDPFIEHAKTKAFFMKWNPGLAPNEDALIWTTKDINPSYSHTTLMSASVPYEVLA